MHINWLTLQLGVSHKIEIEKDGEKAEFVATVSGPPSVDGRTMQFDFAPTSTNAHALLSWYQGM